jgi:small subunit ribosomal protein S8
LSLLPEFCFYTLEKFLFDSQFANIKNGQLAKRSYVLQRRKKICESFLKILWKEGFILGYQTDQTDESQIKIFLKYKNKTPVINSIRLISKPSRRIYYTIKQIWKIDSNKSFIILSTNRGIKSITECKKLKIGGEPFISIN